MYEPICSRNLRTRNSWQYKSRTIPIWRWLTRICLQEMMTLMAKTSPNASNPAPSRLTVFIRVTSHRISLRLLWPVLGRNSMYRYWPCTDKRAQEPSKSTSMLNIRLIRRCSLNSDSTRWINCCFQMKRTLIQSLKFSSPSSTKTVILVSYKHTFFVWWNLKTSKTKTTSSCPALRTRRKINLRKSLKTILQLPLKKLLVASPGQIRQWLRNLWDQQGVRSRR